MAASSDAGAAAADDADVELLARAAAVREEERIAAQLEARISLARSLTDATAKRLDERHEARLVLAERQEALQAAQQRLDMLHQGVAACELRLGLSRQRLVESGQQLEVLRARGAVAEEFHRSKTIQLGVLSGRLQERRQQHVELQRAALDQRLRVGVAAWRPRYVREEALGRWRTYLAGLHARRARSHDALELWSSTALHRAVRAWRSTTSTGRSTGEGLSRSLLKHLEGAPSEDIK